MAGAEDEPENPYVSRGGLKLAAALDKFGLTGKVHGALAIDIGASTGGFTDCLLQNGATRVVGIEVGHGQLHTRLRGDPRIELIEGAHFKTMALSIAPGPFDFFVVDVSFIAARTMLRGLAFRLRAGAEGVILVKPQFELPTGYVHKGQVKNEGLREWALARVKTKAEGLGFELIATADSPVPGGEGTIEILTHWRFRERGQRMPSLPGETPKPRLPPSPPRTAASPKATGAAVKAAKKTGETGDRGRATGDRQWSEPESVPALANEVASWFAICAPGLEEVTAGELRALGETASVVPGGVSWKGTLSSGFRANLWLRSATRVVRRLVELRARDFPALYKKARTVPWEHYIADLDQVEYKATAHKSRLTHTGRIEETLKSAIRDRLDEKRAGAAAAKGPALVMARGVDDIFTLSIDASGEILHKRGYREENALAPMRESLGAAVLTLAGWTPSEPLWDVMCGSGTFPIEAAWMALGRAPGRERTFACQRWAGADASALAALRSQAVAGEKLNPGVALHGSDRDPTVIDAARRNAERAGVARHLDFRCAELADLPDATGVPGLVFANAPYGKRVGDGDLAPTYAALGRLVRERFRGWRLALITSEPALAKATGLTWKHEHPLVTGGLRIRLYVS